MGSEMDSNSSVFKSIALKTGVILLGIVVVLYLADYPELRFRIFRNQAPYGSVTVNVYYAVPQKTRKMEYDFRFSAAGNVCKLCASAHGLCALLVSAKAHR